MMSLVTQAEKEEQAALEAKQQAVAPAKEAGGYDTTQTQDWSNELAPAAPAAPEVADVSKCSLSNFTNIL
jgi:hypothetical protein